LLCLDLRWPCFDPRKIRHGAKRPTPELPQPISECAKRFGLRPRSCRFRQSGQTKAIVTLPLCREPQAKSSRPLSPYTHSPLPRGGKAAASRPQSKVPSAQQVAPDLSPAYAALKGGSVGDAFAARNTTRPCAWPGRLLPGRRGRRPRGRRDSSGAEASVHGPAHRPGECR